MIVRELVGILSVKIKSRHDNYSDQFNRIFIVKVLMMCSFVMGISWFKDSINCIVAADISSDFVSSACWIQGVYIYEELKTRVDDIAYYGIPKDMDMNGMLENGELCSTEPRLLSGWGAATKKKLISETCRPLTKTFFLQYQWIPFYIGAMAIIFYLPYILHLYGNNDMISLKRSLKNGDADPELVVRTYFNRKTNPVRYHWFRIIFNYFIKLLYVIVNVIGLYGTDNLLYGKFIDYGTKWIRWNRLENHIAYDYMGARDHPKPGHEVLPPFGYCELYESAKDIKSTRANKHKFVCELSQNILCQYALILLWFTLISGLVISILGFVVLLIDHVITFMFILRNGNMARKIYGKLSLRECEYLEFIRRRDIPFYAEVLQKLKEEKFGMRIENGLNSGSLPCESPPPGFEEATQNSRL